MSINNNWHWCHSNVISWWEVFSKFIGLLESPWNFIILNSWIAKRYLWELNAPPFFIPKYNFQFVIHVQFSCAVQQNVNRYFDKLIVWKNIIEIRKYTFYLSTYNHFDLNISNLRYCHFVSKIDWIDKQLASQARVQMKNMDI